jgi:uncharacterized protein YbbK (DUF523 family)
MAERPRLLVSACLLGRPIRYDGSAKPLDARSLDRWCAEGRVVAACPELAAGLATPRAPAEIMGHGGADVLAGAAEVMELGGTIVTAAYVQGARATLELALRSGCTLALLTDGSPSCGSSYVHDGTFTGQRRPGDGVAAALLRQNGIQVFSPAEMTVLGRLMDP